MHEEGKNWNDVRICHQLWQTFPPITFVLLKNLDAMLTMIFLTQVTRSTQPHIHMYMFCPYVISTLYQLLEEYKWELSKDTSLVQFFSQLYT
jgi:hypothetical protein